MRSTTEKFNTNNAWGFGGAIGTVTAYENGYSVRKGHACFRHLNDERFCRYYDDEGEEISKADFEEATEQ